MYSTTCTTEFFSGYIQYRTFSARSNAWGSTGSDRQPTRSQAACYNDSTHDVPIPSTAYRHRRPASLVFLTARSRPILNRLYTDIA